MAYVVNTKTTAGTGGSVTVKLPAHLDDDVVFIFVSGLNGTGIAAPAGWESIGSLSNSGSARNAGFYQRVVTAPLSAPTVTSTNAAFKLGAVAIVVRGADVSSTTSAFDDFEESTTGGALSVTSPALTLADSNELILLITTGERSAEDPFFAAGDCVDLEYINDSVSSHFILGTGYTYSQASPSPQYTAYTADDANSGIGIFAIGVIDNGDGHVAGYPKQGTAADLIYFNIASHAESVTGEVDVTNVSFTPQITSITSAESSVTQTTINDSFTGEGAVHKLFPNPIGLGQQSNSGETGNLLIRGVTLTSTIDLSNSRLSMSAAADSINVASLDDLGRLIGFGDATNASMFLYDGKDAAVKSTLGVQTYVIDTAATGYEIDTFGGGSLDWTAVKHIIHGTMPSSYSSYYFYAGPLYKLSAMVMLGGSSTLPCTFDDCAKAAIGGALNTVTNQSGQTKGQFYSLQDITIGDGTDSIYWKSQYQAIEFPQAYNYSKGIVQAQTDASSTTLKILASASCTMDFDVTTIDMGNYHNFIVDASSSSSAAYSFESCTVLNATPTLQAIGLDKYSGMSLIGCKELTINGFNDKATKTLGSVTVSNCVDSYAVTVTSENEFGALTDCVFKNNATSILITGNQTGTWSDPNLTVSGNTYDIEYSGTTDFSIQSANVLTVNNSSSGTLTTVTPTFDLTVNSSQTGSTINVFTTTTQTVLDTEASATQLVYTHSSETVDITVLKDGYIPYRQTGLALSGSVTVDVQLIKSREYNASHGLTYTTDASWSRSLNQLTVPTWGVTGQNVFSLILQSFRTESSLANTAFNMEMDGAGSLFLTNDAEGASDASIENLIECGVAYIDTSGATTASWVAVKSVGTATGFTGEYQQVDGSGTTDARATGIFNEVVKMYGDASHGNFDYTDHLVLKYQPNTYRETRVDVLSSYGVSALAPTLYIVALEPVAIDITSGDPAISITIVDHTGAPLVVDGKSFDFEIQDNGANSAEGILRELNYNLSLDATYQGRDPFNWPELVLQSGSSYETIRGRVEGLSGLHGVYVSRSAADHPDFVRHQSNDGTYYVKPITASISISNLPDDVGGDTLLYIYNNTTATTIYSGDPAGTSYSDSYTDGDAAYASGGDSILIRFAHINGGTSSEYGQTIVLATTDGIAADGDNFIAADSVYATNAIDGSGVTKFSYSSVDDQFNLTVNSNFTAAELYAFYCYTLTTSNGIIGAFGAFTASDAGNYKNVTAIADIFIDNETTASKRQTDTARIYKDDGSYPVLDPTTSGFGIDINWQNVVYVVTAGSGLTAGQAAELTAAAEASTVNTKIGTPSVTVSDDIAAISAGGDATQAKQDTIIANLATVDSIVDSILTDTSTTIPAQISALTAPDNASIAAIKTKTDSLTFTKANELDANIQSVNDVTVSGTGATGDEWGP